MILSLCIMSNNGDVVRCKKKHGFTLIEIMIVLAIIGSLLILTSQLFTSFTGASLGEQPKDQLNYYFSMARSRSLNTGKKHTLIINLEKRTLGLRTFSALLDNTLDSNLSKLSLSLASKTLQQTKDDTSEDRIKALKKARSDTKWVVKPIGLPKKLIHIYSISKLELKGPIIRLFFYPNGTSDSIIFELGNINDELDRSYLFLPRFNQNALTISQLQFHQPEIKDEFKFYKK